jgi:hypothetical protein
LSRIAALLIATAALTAPVVVPGLAWAQVTGFGGDKVTDHNLGSPDRNYCAALSEKYVRYVGRSEAGPHSNRKPDVVGGVALAKCAEGDTAAAIPILERKLTDARIELPRRD